MSRFQETFNYNNNSFSFGDMFTAFIVLLLMITVGFQKYSSTKDGTIKKINGMFKDFKDNDCNPFSPSEKCRSIVDCLKSINEPAWK